MKTNARLSFILAGVAVLLAALVYSCGGGGGSSYGGGSNGTTITPISTVEVVACHVAGTTDVSIVSMTAGFSPASISVPLNTTVKWTNADSINHTVTSTTVPLYGDFNATVTPGTSVCMKFTSAGAFNYHCSIHPTTMIGIVTVQ